MSSDRAADGSELPDIDDRLVEPETRYEMLDGELIYVSPAKEPHAERHAQLCVLIGAHCGPEFKVACDLLTRTSQDDDFAPDVSVYPRALDPRTGRRQLPQLVFEVVSTQSMGDATRKAAKLAARGVRRMFAIDVRRSRALEWSAARGRWSVLDNSGQISDPTLQVPLPIEAMIRDAKTDGVVARALIAKRTPEIEAARAEDRAKGVAEGLAKGLAKGVARGRAEGVARGRAEGVARGRAEGWAEAVLSLLALRGLAPDREARERILAERDLARLGRWLAHASTCRSVAELLAESD
jgi:Uma2 family endonuclease